MIEVEDINIEKLKPLVNNHDLWNLLDKYLKKLYTLKSREIGKLGDPIELYRLQGYISCLEHLHNLKVNVNALKS